MFIVLCESVPSVKTWMEVIYDRHIGVRGGGGGGGGAGGLQPP